MNNYYLSYLWYKNNQASICVTMYGTKKHLDESLDTYNNMTKSFLSPHLI